MKKLFAFLFTLVLAVTLMGCETTDKVQGITDTEIIIGNTAATTGGFAAVGIPFNIAMQVVFDQYNAANPDGRQIKFIHYDDNFNGETGLALTKKLVEEDKVFALVGHFGTNTVNATMDYLLESGVPMVYGVTGVNSLFYENEPENNILSVQPIYRTEGRVLLARILHESLFGAEQNQKLPATAKIAVLYSGDDAGNSIKVGIEDEAKSAKIESRVTYQEFTETTATSAVTTVLAQNPDVIILAANQAPTTAAAKVLREQNSKTPVFTSYANAVGQFTPAQEIVPAEGDKPASAKPLPFDVYANAWVDITDATKPGPTAEMIGGDGTLAGFNFPLEYLPGFSDVYWTKFVKSMNDSSIVVGDYSAKALWANAYAIAGFIAATQFVELLNRVDLDTVTWESFIEAAASQPLQLPMAGTIDWTDGRRVGLDQLSLNKMSYPATGPAFAKVRNLESLETINAK